MLEENGGAPTQSIQDDAAEQPDEGTQRLERLVELLEGDRLGYRLERFVSEEREKLAQALSSDNFDIAPTTGVKAQDQCNRLLEYEAAIAPYLEFFAVGCAYSSTENARLWCDFIERIATCSSHAEGRYNPTLLKLSLYPSLLLLYSAGLVCVARESWGVYKRLLSHNFALDLQEPAPFVKRINLFEVMEEGVQSQFPGKEGQLTPLHNRIPEILFPRLGRYFLNPTRYDLAFTQLEILLGAAYVFADEEAETRQGKPVSADCWMPPWRYWNRAYIYNSSVERVVSEALAEAETWPPVAAGLFGGMTENFVNITVKMNARLAKRGLG